MFLFRSKHDHMGEQFTSVMTALRHQFTIGAIVPRSHLEPGERMRI
jgi:hypothetical protein